MGATILSPGTDQDSPRGNPLQLARAGRIVGAAHAERFMVENFANVMAENQDAILRWQREEAGWVEDGGQPRKTHPDAGYTVQAGYGQSSPLPGAYRVSPLPCRLVTGGRGKDQRVGGCRIAVILVARRCVQ